MPSSKSPTKETLTWTVPDDESPERLDRWVARQTPTMSRSKVQGLIAEGHLSIDGRLVDNSAHRVRPGETIRLEIPPPVAAEPEAQRIALDIVFEDDHLIVVNKPPGMVVHPAPGNPDRTLVNALLAHCGGSLKGIGGVARPGIVHRIDKETSGLLVAAKTEAAHAGLSAQLAAHTMRRVYDAIVWGCPRPARGVVTGAIGRSTRDRKKMAVVRSGGKPAETHYQTVAAFGTIAAHLECRLATGRTHQIRVHLSSLGHGLVGDPTYGAAPARVIALLSATAATFVKSFPRQALHARSLGFVHPVTGREHHFTHDMPPDMASLVNNLTRGLKKPG